MSSPLDQPTLQRAGAAPDRLGKVLAAAGAVAGSLWLGWYTSVTGQVYQSLFVMAIVLGGAFVLVRGGAGLRTGYNLFIMSLALGYRALPVTHDLKIIPAEIVLWGLFAWVALEAALHPAKRVNWRLPAWLTVFAAFWLVTWGPFHQGPIRALDTQLSEFRDFLHLIPLYVVTRRLLRKPSDVASVLGLFYGICVWIAAMGVMEFYFPDSLSLLPGFVTSAQHLITEEGFNRALFSFYGSPTATFMCTMALPLVLMLWPQRSRIATKSWLVAGTGLLLWAIFIGGYRSMWFTVVVEAAVYLFCVRKPWPALALITLATVSYAVAMTSQSSVTVQRTGSLVAALEGRPTDSSAASRLNMAYDCLRSAVTVPEGLGWAGIGWCHSDFLQVAANQGAAAGIFFLLVYLNTLRKAIRRAARSDASVEERTVDIALAVAFVGTGMVLLFEGVEVLPQSVLPAWLIWVIVDLVLRSPGLSERKERAAWHPA